jgi:hypothetical protein
MRTSATPFSHLNHPRGHSYQGRSVHLDDGSPRIPFEQAILGILDIMAPLAGIQNPVVS